MKAIIITILMVALSVHQVNALELKHPRDKWVHATGSALCSLFIRGMTGGFSNTKAKKPLIYAFSVCFGLGLVKEFLIDEKHDNGDIWADLGGTTAGLVIFTW